jgi:hypothetical protein
VAQLVQSRTLFSHVPTDLIAARAAIAAALAGPSAEKSAQPPAVAPGGDLAYLLTYTHSGADTTLVVTDNVPALTPVNAATGPGTVERAGQAITWTVSVGAGDTVTLNIQATAALAPPGAAVNTAVFSSTQVLTRQATVVVYQAQVFLPLLLR